MGNKNCTRTYRKADKKADKKAVTKADTSLNLDTVTVLAEDLSDIQSIQNFFNLHHVDDTSDINSSLQDRLQYASNLYDTDKSQSHLKWKYSIRQDGNGNLYFYPSLSVMKKTEPEPKSKLDIAVKEAEQFCYQLILLSDKLKNEHADFDKIRKKVNSFGFSYINIRVKSFVYYDECKNEWMNVYNIVRDIVYNGRKIISNNSTLTKEEKLQKIYDTMNNKPLEDFTTFKNVLYKGGSFTIKNSHSIQNIGEIILYAIQNTVDHYFTPFFITNFQNNSNVKTFKLIFQLASLYSQDCSLFNEYPISHSTYEIRWRNVTNCIYKALDKNITQINENSCKKNFIKIIHHSVDTGLSALINSGNKLTCEEICRVLNDSINFNLKNYLICRNIIDEESQFLSNLSLEDINSLSLSISNIILIEYDKMKIDILTIYITEEFLLLKKEYLYSFNSLKKHCDLYKSMYQDAIWREIEINNLKKTGL